MSFSSFLLGLFEGFVNPANRLFIPTIILSLLIAVLVTVLSSDRKWSLLANSLFSKKIWTHPSIRLDFQLFFFNGCLRLIVFTVFSGLLISSNQVTLWSMKVLNQLFGDSQFFVSGPVMQKISYTLLSFVVLDLFRFFQHYLMHKVPFLWNYHQVHHSAEVLTPLTLNRVHPVEMFIGIARTTLAISLSTALFIYIFRAPVSGIDILGVNLFGFLFNAFGSNLRHSHFWLSFGIFEYIFISPAQHQVHHSKDEKHFDKNFGVSLSIWDQLMGSFVRTKRQKPDGLSFGLAHNKKSNFWQSIKLFG